MEEPKIYGLKVMMDVDVKHSTSDGTSQPFQPSLRFP
jgi:hypothetical protein